MTLNPEQARGLMLQQQLRAGTVLDERVLQCFASLPREAFVPAAYRGFAFADEPLPLDCGQQMMTPLQEGLLLQALATRPGDRVLEVGTGSGYLSACLARLSSRVTTVEIFPQLAAAARAKLLEFGIANCEVLVDDVFQLEDQLVDVIVVTGSLPQPWPAFERWLTVGGRLCQVVGQSLPMAAWRIERTGEREFCRTRLFETALPPLLNAPAPPGFRF